MPTLTMAADSTDAEVLERFEDFASRLPKGTARDAVELATSLLRSGQDVIIAASDDAVTPPKPPNCLA